VQYIAEKQRLGFAANPLPVDPPAQKHHKKETQAPIGKIIKIGSATFRSNFESGSIGSVDLIGVNSFKISLDN
jgi:hypothetical protein